MDIPIKTGIKVQQLEPPEYPAFYGIVLPIIAFLGITGNIICALVGTNHNLPGDHRQEHLCTGKYKSLPSWGSQETSFVHW